VHKKEGAINWIDKEIKYFKKIRGEENILAIINQMQLQTQFIPMKKRLFQKP